MDCVLCKKPIKSYNEKFNRLKIDEFNNVDICSDCIDKFLKWQQNVFVTLFPTRLAKSWVKRNEL